MKKYIAGMFLGMFLVVNVVHADTVQDQYQATLVQLITLLQQQVALLMAQLQAVQSEQATMHTKIDTVVQNTTPVFGAVTSVPTPIPTPSLVVPEVVKNLELSVHLCPRSQCTAGGQYLDSYAVRSAYFENGKNVVGVPITFSTDSGVFDGSPSGTPVSTLITHGVTGGDNGGVDTGFNSTATSTYITASVNGISKTVYLNTVKPYGY